MAARRLSLIVHVYVWAFPSLAARVDKAMKIELTRAAANCDALTSGIPMTLAAEPVKKKSKTFQEFRDRCLRLTDRHEVEFYGGYKPVSTVSGQRIKLGHCKVVLSSSRSASTLVSANTSGAKPWLDPSNAACFVVVEERQQDELVATELCADLARPWMEWFAEQCVGSSFANMLVSLPHSIDGTERKLGSLYQPRTWPRLDEQAAFGASDSIEVVRMGASAIKLFKSPKHFLSEVSALNDVRGANAFNFPLGSFVAEGSFALIYPVGFSDLQSWLEKKCKLDGEDTHWQRAAQIVRHELFTSHAVHLMAWVVNHNLGKPLDNFGDCTDFVMHAMLLYRRLDEKKWVYGDADPRKVIIGHFGQRLIDHSNVVPRESMLREDWKRWKTSKGHQIKHFLEIAYKSYLKQDALEAATQALESFLGG